jgi:dolichol-phosphate mannosyltransferase
MNLSSRPRLSIVIPIFNEEPNIPLLIGHLEDFLLKIRDVRVDIIFVDDHSTDNSSTLLRDACMQNQTYRYLRLSRNSGSHIAILAGLKYSEGDCAVFLAADLQDPPELIPKMLEQWRMGNHVVWAVRERREGVSRIQKFFSFIFYQLLNWVVHGAFPRQGADFALLDREVIDALLESVGVNPSLGMQIARLGFNQTHIPYTKQPRQFGRSKWNVERKFLAFADAFVSFSYKPLRLMSYIGILSSLLGFVYAFVVVTIRLAKGTPVHGWASLMIVLLIIGGIQMTMMGVIGEYLWRTLEAARKSPLFFIESSVGLEGHERHAASEQHSK